MNRQQNIDAIRARGKTPWDMVVIGGGATGLGVALDAASRGYDTLLVEQHDFARGTSSRSTKLIHGGVRYLKQGNIGLVMESLRERGRLCVNAPHLVRHQSFIVPVYSWWEGPFYGIGMKLYDRMAGDLGLQPSRVQSLENLKKMCPTLETNGLRQGVLYYDGQFDDARLAVTLAASIHDVGGVALNYMQVVGLMHEGDLVAGAHVRNVLLGEEFEVRAKAVVNATGIFTDAVRVMDDAKAPPMMALSRGSHIVLPRDFWPGEHAIMIPHTADGRVLFAVPWHGHVIVGTTDVPVSGVSMEPHPDEAELAFLLSHAGVYLTHKPKPEDVLSCFSGLRPLVRSEAAGSTASMSRDHTVVISHSGLVTITGGKWTTYRKMAEDTVNQVQALLGWPERRCETATMALHGAMPVDDASHLSVYGTEAAEVIALADTMERGRTVLHPALPYWRAEVVWAARREMACSVEDVLARRLRALFLNARAAMDCATEVASLLGGELGWDEARYAREVAAFQQVARGYLMRT